MNTVAPPNAKNFTTATPDLTDNQQLNKKADEEAILTKFLDGKSDTNGLNKIEGEDWTDVKHSERKKRDRILDDGVLIKLMKKSDYEGFKRLFTNIGIMVGTAYAIHRIDVFPLTSMEEMSPLQFYKMLSFVGLYLFYGFQFQCFAFAGQHEFLHGNAFKTKWINDVVLFCVGCICFEFGTHERVMHKQHHTYTNNIDKDPELTSFYTREELENPHFRNVASSKLAFFKGFWDIIFPLKCRLLRLINSARGIPVDYSGAGWSMKTETYSKESHILDDLQRSAMMQLLFYVATFTCFGRVQHGIRFLFFWWIIPVIVGYPAVNYVRNLEHADCEVSKEPNMLRNTRTVESNPLIRHLLWETNFHAEHHCYPMVPFFNLPKLHELMKDHVIHGECKHFTQQQWACIKQGGWIDKQRMGAGDDHINNEFVGAKLK